jgi:type II secretory pathway predicted ATPase ExeA
MAAPGYRDFHKLKRTVFGRGIPTKYLLEYTQAKELGSEFSALVEDGGIGLLVGEVGIGKTTALRGFVDSLDDRACKICYQGGNKHSTAVLQEMVTQMGYHPGHLRANCLRQLSGAISRLWKEQRKKTFIILDDAQTVEESLLEDLRLLTNFEFDSSEPLALLLIGHPSLQVRLRKPIHLALWDRLRMLYRLEGLSLEETHQYIDRHLEAAGGSGGLFAPEAKVAVFEHSQGIPRRINRIALEAVKLSARNKIKTVDQKLISVAVKVFDGV